MGAYPLLAVHDQSSLVPVGLTGSVRRVHRVAVRQIICGVTHRFYRLK